jgi:hypothetical protein
VQCLPPSRSSYHFYQNIPLASATLIVNTSAMKSAFLAFRIVVTERVVNNAGPQYGAGGGSCKINQWGNFFIIE